jgi:3-hydroxyacyl-[acyl-carrier protein] dehydratase/trans-2-decenoyl-[acyl-carrier protein] isomerase
MLILLIIIYNSSKLFLYYNHDKSSIKGVKFMKKNSFTYDELISCGNGELFGPGNAKLPLPPMLMFDRITEINEDNGAFSKGSLKAELDIKDDLWFFDCHFKGDPVMPGCLGLDAMWQLVGFYLGWLGNPGKGRALGVSAVKFTGEVLQNVKNVRYEIDMKKIMAPGGTTVGLANGLVFADDKKIYSAESLKVGLFK